MIPSFDLLTPGAGWLLGALIKITVVLVVATALALGLRRASASVRHLVWSAAIVAVLTLPILAALLEAADRLGLDRAPRLLMSGRLPMPYTSGLFRPDIVLPESAAEWDDRRRRAVLCHELAHLRRRRALTPA